VEQWFQNTRGLVIVILAVVTCAVLLAIEPGDGFPSGAGSSSGGGDTTATTTVSTLPQATTTTVARNTIQEGTPDTGSTTTLQTRLAQLGYAVTVDGSFGPGTTEQVKKFQTDHKLPATGIVDAATWSALEANPTTSTTAATTTTKG
jgi:peptidoglycan hydrolase-like protein with peptidoglycan-binding domain